MTNGDLAFTGWMVFLIGVVMLDDSVATTGFAICVVGIYLVLWKMFITPRIDRWLNK